MFNILELRKIDLGNNHLTGDIPNGIDNLKNADFLSLSNNQLSGRIPRGIGNLTMLQELYLDHNNLQGDIPREFGDLQSLKTTYLDTNGFSGHIPSSIFNILELQGIDLGYNNFTGDIPDGIANLKNADFISLSNNQLSGRIPRGIGNLTMLQVLYLDHNNLQDEGQSKTQTETIPTVGYIAPEYGSFGVVSTKADVYSYGITLIEVFTRKKPIEDMFVSRMSLRNWVSASVPHAIIQIIDSNLLQGDEQHISNILTSTCSILELALNCCNDVPETRNNMTDVVASLNKIKIMFKQRNKTIFGRIA